MTARENVFSGSVGDLLGVEQGSLASNGPVPLTCPAEGENVTASDQNVSNAAIC